MTNKLRVNAIKCLSCKTIIESTHVHDFVRCTCEKVAVDGGLDYAKRLYPDGNPEDHYIEMSVEQD